MRTSERRASALFQQLLTSLQALSQQTAPESVHRVRTSARRIQSALEFYRPGLTAKHRAALKELDKIRRRAGKLRDLEVQLGLLDEIANRSARGDREVVAKALKERRRKQSRRLAPMVERFLGSRSPERLRKVAALLQAQLRDLSGAHPLADARLELQLLRQGSVSADLQDAERLHDLRLRLKKIRYLAEIAPPTAVQKAFIADLKQPQDAIGRWHDWLRLAQVARQVLEEKQSPLRVEIEALCSSHHDAALTAARRVLLGTDVSGIRKGSSSVRPIPGRFRATG